MDEQLEQLIEPAPKPAHLRRIESILPPPAAHDRLERLHRLALPPAQAPWRGRATGSRCRPFGAHFARRPPEIDRQKKKIERNTRQFVARQRRPTTCSADGRARHRQVVADPRVPARLCAARALAADRGRQGRAGRSWRDIVEVVSSAPEKLHQCFSDDLTLRRRRGRATRRSKVGPRRLGRAAQSPNVLIYATTNRRHLLPEVHEGQPQPTPHTADGEVHPGEVIEEKISLSERFGLWVSFYPFSQNEYLTIVGQWLSYFGVDQADDRGARGPRRWCGRWSAARAAGRVALAVRARLVRTRKRVSAAS